MVDAGVEIMERDGLQALSVRKLAAEVGTSTMAVYTHFGGMTGLVDAVASEVFTRFADALNGVPHTDDPVADFIRMGIEYHRFALANPERYSLMFGVGSPTSVARFRADLTVTGTAAGRQDWGLSFEALLTAVRRMIAAGRIRDDGVEVVAGRFWSISHGAVMLEMVGFFGHEGHGLAQILGPTSLDFIVGMGDDRERATESLAAALNSLGTQR